MRLRASSSCAYYFLIQFAFIFRIILFVRGVDKIFFSATESLLAKHDQW